MFFYGARLHFGWIHIRIAKYQCGVSIIILSLGSISYYSTCNIRYKALNCYIEGFKELIEELLFGLLFRYCLLQI